MTTPSNQKHIVGEFMTKDGYALIRDLKSTSVFHLLSDYTNRIENESKEVLCSIKELFIRAEKEEIVSFIEKIEIAQVDIHGFRNVDYQSLPMVYLQGVGYKRLYLSGQVSIRDERKRFYIDNDYVLTNDVGFYIYTQHKTTREYLMGLTQKEIQGENWVLNSYSHVFIPQPKEEALFQKQRGLVDKNNIAEKGIQYD